METTSQNRDGTVLPEPTLGGASLRILLPLLTAGAIIWLEPVLGRLAHDRPGIVPVALLSLIVGLVSPGSRRWLVVMLCFGVSLLAFRDFFRALHPNDLPLEFRGPILMRLYAAGWLVLSGLAGAAAIGEALNPGAIWARRCYFLAAALYFTGHGVLEFLKLPTWHSPVLVTIGVVSLVGAWMADKVVDAEPEPEIVDEDLRAIAVRTTERTAASSRREWVEKS